MDHDNLIKSELHVNAVFHESISKCSGKYYIDQDFNQRSSNGEDLEFSLGINRVSAKSNSSDELSPTPTHQTLIKSSSVACSDLAKFCLEALKYLKMANVHAGKGKMESSLRLMEKCSTIASEIATKSEDLENEAKNTCDLIQSAIIHAHNDGNMSSNNIIKLNNTWKKIQRIREYWCSVTQQCEDLENLSLLKDLSIHLEDEYIQELKDYHINWLTLGAIYIKNKISLHNFDEESSDILGLVKGVVISNMESIEAAIESNNHLQHNVDNRLRNYYITDIPVAVKKPQNLVPTARSSFVSLQNNNNTISSSYQSVIANSYAHASSLAERSLAALQCHKIALMRAKKGKIDSSLNTIKKCSDIAIEMVHEAVELVNEAKRISEALQDAILIAHNDRNISNEEKITINNVRKKSESIKKFWLGVVKHCEHLEDIDLLKDLSDLEDKYIDELNSSFLNWLALGKINYYATFEGLDAETQHIVNRIMNIRAH